MQMNVQQAYNAWSETYDADENLTRDLDSVVMVQTLGERQFSSILEMGCGTGKNAVLLAKIGKAVVLPDNVLFSR